MKKQYVGIIALLVLLVNAPIVSMEESHAQAVSPKSDDDALRVMTYNIRRKGKEAVPAREWQNRLPLVQKVLNQVQPDIIGLQEPTDEQIADLRKNFPHFAAFGEGRGASWWGLGTDEHNPIFYNKKMFTLLEHGTFSINKQTRWMPWHAQQTGWLPRICTWGKFKVNATGQEFYLYNTHLDHMYEAAQVQNAQMIMQHIAEHTHGLPVIVTGDFNTQFAGGIKEVFAGFKHTKDSAQQRVGPHETSTGWDSKELKWIDHILINKADTIDVLQYHVVDHKGEAYPSDHRPVFVDIVLKK